MLRSLNLLFSPEKEWEKMALNPPRASLVLLLGLIPLIVICLGLEGWGLLHFGDIIGGFGRIKFPQVRVIKYAVFYGIAVLVVVLLGAQLLRNVSQSFNLTSTFGACVVLMAYGYCPIVLLRCAAAFPEINSWICWAVGAVLSARILYHGVALWLRPEQTKGFGVFLVSLMYLLALSALVNFASVQVLRGRLLKSVYPEGGSAPSLVTNANFNALSLPAFRG